MTSPSMQGSGRRTVTSGVDDELQIIPDAGEGSGWLLFAGTVLGLAGLMRIIDSIWAFHYSGTLPDGVTLRDGILGSNLTTYAWTWLVVGVVLIVASVLILARSQIARWIGFFAAAIGALSAMTWMPYYPIWSLTYVGVAVMTFYALARYGGRDSI
jgi:hypothetical protein